MGSAFGYSSTERPKYEVLEKKENYEIREYESQIRIEVETESNELSTSSGFSDLAGYIFGKNVSKTSIEMTSPVSTEFEENKNEKIEMTSPVSTELNENKKIIMSFILPSKFKKIEELPIPLNKKVKFVELKKQKYAVLTFSGMWDENYALEKEKELKNYLKEDSIEFDIKPQLWRYDPPWTIWFLRTIEIALKIK
jgi:hypothetical protein